MITNGQDEIFIFDDEFGNYVKVKRSPRSIGEPFWYIYNNDTMKWYRATYFAVNELYFEHRVHPREILIEKFKEKGPCPPPDSWDGFFPDEIRGGEPFIDMHY